MIIPPSSKGGLGQLDMSSGSQLQSGLLPAVDKEECVAQESRRKAQVGTESDGSPESLSSRISTEPHYLLYLLYFFFF